MIYGMDLKALDQLYRNATDASAGITFTDGDGLIVHVNDIFCKMAGMHAEDFLGKRHADVLPKISDSVDEELLARHFYHHKQWRGELLFQDKNGHEVWTDTTILPVIDEMGGMAGLFTLSLDITEKKNIERELGNNQQKLGFVLDSLQTAFWEWDMRTNTAWYNDNWPRMLGYESSEMPKDFRGWSDYVHPEDRERGTQEMLYHIKNKTSALVSLQRFRHKDGKWVHVMTKGHVVERDQNGRAVRLIGVNHDISAISRLEDFSVHIQDLAGLGIWDVDIQTGEIYWSRKIYEIFDIDPTGPAPSSRPALQKVSPEFREQVEKSFELLTKKGIPYDYEVKMRNGRWVRIAGRVDSYEGKPYRAFGIVQDINESKMAEEALKTSQETLQVALEAGRFGVWDWNISQDQAYWSPTMCELFEAPKDKTSFTYEDARAPIHPDDRERVERECNLSLEQENRCDNTYRIKNGDSWRWIRAVANIRRDENGKEKRMIGVTWDVTPQMETQQAQEAAILEAQKTSKMKSQFMATVSHEIRTPMSGVIGMTELLSETELTAGQREIVQTIKTCGENLLTLVNDILDYSKLEADKVRLDKRSFKLTDTIKNTLDLFQYKARQKNIQLIFQVDKDVPEVIVQDEARLYQILFNLVGNAVKFTADGEVKVLVKTKQNKLIFQVIDNGIGIPSDKTEIIFESFAQLSPGHQTETSGTGLGLSISRSLVSLMGGTLNVESQLNKGSCFYFDIEFDQSNYIAPQESKIQTKNTPVDLSKLHVLVVEDNPINLKLLVSILQRHEVQIDVAEDGIIAVNKVCEKKYDLVFMDVQMPRLDGLSATKQIRSMDQLHHQPIIIALTANVSPEHQEECLEAGMNDFLPKPIRVQTIRSLLQYHAANIQDNDHYISAQKSTPQKRRGPVLNRDRLFREFSGFEDLLLQFIDIFLGNYASYLQQIETDLGNDRLADVAAGVHTFRGIVGNFQSTVIMKNLELLEDIAKNNNLNATRDCFIDTTSLIGKLVEEIQALRTILAPIQN